MASVAAARMEELAELLAGEGQEPPPPRSRGGVPISDIMIICSSPLGLGKAGEGLFPPPLLFRGWGVYEASEAQPLRATQVNIMDTYRTP